MSTDDLPLFTIADVEEQFASLTFESFDQEAAYALGTLAAEIIREREIPLAVQVVIGDHIVYKAALNGVGAGTADWLRRKANLAKLDGVPSLLVRLRLEADGASFDGRGLNDGDYAAYGGAFPIVVDGAVVGTLTTSGAADVVDHDVAVGAIRSYLFN